MCNIFVLNMLKRNCFIEKANTYCFQLSPYHEFKAMSHISVMSQCVNKNLRAPTPLALFAKM